MLAGSPSERNACTANDTPPHAVSVSVSGSGSISNNRGDSVGEALLALITPHTNPQCSPPGCKINGIRPLRDTTLHRNPCGSRQLSQISPPTYRRIGVLAQQRRSAPQNRRLAVKIAGIPLAIQIVLKVVLLT